MVFEFFHAKKHDRFTVLLDEIEAIFNEIEEYVKEEVEIESALFDPAHASFSQLHDIIRRRVKDSDRNQEERGLVQRCIELKPLLNAINEDLALQLRKHIAKIVWSLRSLNKSLICLQANIEADSTYHLTENYKSAKAAILGILDELKKSIFKAKQCIRYLWGLKHKKQTEVPQFKMAVFISPELIKRYKEYLRNYHEPRYGVKSDDLQSCFTFVIDETIKDIIEIINTQKKAAATVIENYNKARLRGMKRGYNPGRFTRIIFLTDYENNVWVYDVTTPEEHEIAVFDKRDSGRYYEIYSGKIKRDYYGNIKNFKQIKNSMAETS